MLKFTIKASIHSLLHVSFHLDDPQGTYADPCFFVAVAKFCLLGVNDQHRLPEDGPDGPKHVGANA
jgi:hypothetical protein